MIGIINYKAGNAPSVYNAFQSIGVEAKMAETPNDLMKVDGIVLPGVGSAAATLDSLKETEILPALTEAVLKDKKPFLGICIGMQILFDHSEEGDVSCLGWLKGKVVRFDDQVVRVPEMGWNEVVYQKDHPFVKDMGESGHFYFVNSYHVVPENEEDVLGVTDYNGNFCSLVGKENIIGAQFHAEKSGPLGLRLLNNYADWVRGGGLC